MASRRLTDTDSADSLEPIDSTLRVRGLVEADLGQVTAIEEACFVSPWSRATFESLLRRANACLLVAADGDDRILGYAAVWFAGREAELGDLAVSAQVRRSGIGTLLVRAVLEEAVAREIDEVFLEVREANESAQSLYRKHGFETVGRRTRYYAHPVEDALVMRRLLLR